METYIYLYLFLFFPPEGIRLASSQQHSMECNYCDREKH